MKAGQYNYFYRSMDKVRNIARLSYVYGGYSKKDFCELVDISPRTYEDNMRRIRDLLGDNFEEHFNSKNKYSTLNNLGGSKVNNFLINLYYYNSFTEKAFCIFLKTLDIESDKKYTLAELYSHDICDDQGTLNKNLKDLVSEGYLYKGKYDDKIAYKLPRLLENSFEEEELDRIAEFVEFKMNTSFLKVPGHYLLNTLRRNGLDNGIAYKDSYLHQVLDEDIVFNTIKAIENKEKLTFEHLDGQKTLHKKTVYPQKITNGLYGRQYMIGFEDLGEPCKLFRIDRISNIKRSKGSVNLVFDETQFRNIWGVSCVDKPLDRISIVFSFDERERFLLRKLEREKKFGEILQVDSTTYRFDIEVSDFKELVPFLREFYGSIVSIDNKGLKKYIEYDLEGMRGHYAII